METKGKKLRFENDNSGLINCTEVSCRACGAQDGGEGNGKRCWMRRMVEAIMMLMGVIKINEQVNFQLSVASVQLLSLIISAQSSTNRTHLISINKMNNSISILIRIKQFIFPLNSRPIVSQQSIRQYGRSVGLGIVTIQRL